MNPDEPQDQSTPKPSPAPQMTPPPSGPQKTGIKPIVLILIIVGSLLFIGLAIAGIMTASSLINDRISTIMDPSDKTATEKGSGIEIKDSAVTLTANSTVDALCYTYTVPEEYNLNPNSASCLTQVNIEGGDGLTLIKVVAQTGTVTIDEFMEKIRSYDATDIETKRVQLANYEAGVAHYKDSYGLRQVIYFIPDESAKFQYDGKKIGSYMISGAAYNAQLEENVSSIASSFKIK